MNNSLFVRNITGVSNQYNYLGVMKVGEVFFCPSTLTCHEAPNKYADVSYYEIKSVFTRFRSTFRITIFFIDGLILVSYLTFQINTSTTRSWLLRVFNDVSFLRGYFVPTTKGVCFNWKFWVGKNSTRTLPGIESTLLNNFIIYNPFIFLFIK